MGWPVLLWGAGQAPRGGDMSWTSSRNRNSGPGGQNSLTGIPSRGGSKGLGAVRAPHRLVVWGRASKRPKLSPKLSPAVGGR